MPNIYAELSVTSKKKNLDELSTLTGLVSAGGHNINDTTKRGNVLNYSQWDYQTNAVETFYTEEVSGQLLAAFENCITEFIDFIKTNCCKVSICFVIENAADIMPSLTINREMINFAAGLNAEIYFDGLYSSK